MVVGRVCYERVERPAEAGLPDELELDIGMLNAEGGPTAAAAVSAPEADSDSRATSLTRPRATLSFETDVGGVG